MQLYLKHNVQDRALFHVRAVATNLPPDPTVRAQYATFFEDLRQPEEALRLWKQTLEVAPNLELAHFRVTRLLINTNKPNDALDAAEKGLQAAPQSARLYLAKSEILEKQSRYYEARSVLRQAVRGVNDPSLLNRLAEMEDAGGEHAGQYYRQLAVAESKTASADDLKSLLQRGLLASLRDGDAGDAAWFQSGLGSTGSAVHATRTPTTLLLPGGMAALSFVAGGKPSSPHSFLLDYARSVLPHLQEADVKNVSAYTERIHQHFRWIAELRSLGVSSQRGATSVTIEVQDRKAQQNAEKVLDLLGWRCAYLDRAVKLEAARRDPRGAQQTASDLPSMRSACSKTSNGQAI